MTLPRYIILSWSFCIHLCTVAQINQWPNTGSGNRGEALRYTTAAPMHGYIVLKKTNKPYPFKDSLAENILHSVDTLNGIIKVFNLDNHLRVCYIIPYQLAGGKQNLERKILMIPYTNIDYVRVFRDSLESSFVDFVSVQTGQKSELWRVIRKNNITALLDDNVYTFNSPYNIYNPYVKQARKFRDPDSTSYTASQILLVTNNKNKFIVRTVSETFSVRGSIIKFINKEYNPAAAAKDFRTVGKMLDYILEAENKVNRNQTK